jgi:hypothetical protein
VYFKIVPNVHARRARRYVVQLKEVLASRTKIFIVLELITGGELFDKIVSEGRCEPCDAGIDLTECLKMLAMLEGDHKAWACPTPLKARPAWANRPALAKPPGLPDAWPQCACVGGSAI